MFEALRGLRDAVAPESGSLGVAQQPGNKEQNTEAPDTDDLWHAYKMEDPDVVRLVQNSQKKSNSPVRKLKTREEFIRWHAKMEMEKDTELVMKLASTVLEKSAEIDRQLDEELPGMDRTRAQQMEYMEDLIKQNQEAASALQQAYDAAKEKRDLCRKFIKDKTSEALGIEEDNDLDLA